MLGNFIFALAVSLVLGAGLWYLVRFLDRRALLRSLQQTLLLVRVPRTLPASGEAGKDFKAEITTTEQLIANLTALKAPFSFEVMVPHIGEEIHFFVAVPTPYRDVAVKQIQALWSGASVVSAPDDYNIFNPEGTAVGAYATQKEHYALPIRTYAEVNADTFASIVGAFARITEIGEGAALQIIVQPAPKMKKDIYKKIQQLKKGGSVKHVLGKGLMVELEDVERVFSPKTKEEQADEKANRIVDDDTVKALEAKIAKPLFQVNARIVASAASPIQATDILEGIAAGFTELAAPQRNEIRFTKPRFFKGFLHDFSFRIFAPSQAMILNSEEIASFFHLPISTTDTPKVKWLKSKEAPPPPNAPNHGMLIGQSSFRGQLKPIYLTDEDRKRHLYVIGQTGTGKSTLLGNLILSDIRAGRGLAVIDPHGDLVETALSQIPKERIDDVILFEPGDLWRPVGMNMLEFNQDRPEEKTFIVNEMQSIFNKLFPPESMGPMFEQYMRNALLLLMEDMANEPATLIEVPRIFTDAVYRAKKLERIHNPVIVDFWQKEAAKAGGEASLANMTPYITSKFNNFIANDYLRPIIGQPKSAFNFRDVMDSGKILLVNLSKGRLGEINANLMGMVVVGKILMAALSRVDIVDKGKRRDFTLYIDEFQNVSTDSISSILSEARKYSLNLIVAHQFIAQLTDKIKDAVFGNVGSMMAFRVGVQDAEFLVKQFEPIFNENDLMNVDNLNALAKILINGETSKPFNVKVGTESWARGSREYMEKLREYCRLKYGAERQAIEAQIFERLRL